MLFLDINKYTFFQSCQLFTSVAVESAGIDYHVVLAQNALQQSLDQWELQAELMCALVKQTSRHVHHKIGVQVFSKLRHRVSYPAFPHGFLLILNALNDLSFIIFSLVILLKIYKHLTDLAF